MTMQSAWTFLRAFWPDSSDADAGKPATGSTGYVPTLQADDTVKWQAASGAELLVEDGSAEFEFDDTTGDVLYEG